MSPLGLRLAFDHTSPLALRCGFVSTRAYCFVVISDPFLNVLTQDTAVLFDFAVHVRRRVYPPIDLRYPIQVLRLGRCDRPPHFSSDPLPRM
jgi:hypothetical protein